MTYPPAAEAPARLRSDDDESAAAGGARGQSAVTRTRIRTYLRRFMQPPRPSPSGRPRTRGRFISANGCGSRARCSMPVEMRSVPSSTPSARRPLRRKRTMRRGGGPADRGRHLAEAVHDGDRFEAAEEGVDGVSSAGEIESDDAARPALVEPRRERMLGVARRDGWCTVRTAGERARKAASARALATWRSMRSPSVRTPRRASQASKWGMVAPTRTR